MKNFIFVLLAVLSFACENSRQNNLVGEWVHQDPSYSFIFSENGKGFYNYDFEITYKMLKNDRIVINYSHLSKSDTSKIEFLTPKIIKLSSRDLLYKQ